MKYDYLVVGAGLYGSVFAHEAATSMVHIFSIPTIKRCGITLQNLRNLTALRIHR